MVQGYQFIDIGAKGEGIVVAAFDNQVAYCTQAGATVTARVVAALRDLLERGEPGQLLDAIRAWPGGGEPVMLGRAHPHGASIDWRV
jgi:hypothetical protein